MKNLSGRSKARLEHSTRFNLKITHKQCSKFRFRGKRWKIYKEKGRKLHKKRVTYKAFLLGYELKNSPTLRNFIRRGKKWGGRNGEWYKCTIYTPGFVLSISNHLECVLLRLQRRQRTISLLTICWLSAPMSTLNNRA